MPRFAVDVRGPFSLAAARRFLARLAPGAADAAGEAADHAHLAFVPDGCDAAAGVCLREEGGAIVLETFEDADTAAARRQAERILSLDVDGRAFSAVGRRDPVVGPLQERYPGLRLVCFPSPFEAGAWFLLSQRVRTAQAASARARLTEDLGEPVDIHGERLTAFPKPGRIHALESVRGVPERKLVALRALAHAALEGRLHGERLRAMDPGEAAADLQSLPGVGPFSAEGILMRGAGVPDMVATGVPRFGAALQLAYGLARPPDDAERARLAQAWRPYRSWVQVLLRVMLDDEERAPGAWAGSAP